ncbi:MAG: helix-turn-helix domain-containing protein [Chloroflexi bacterium]|nr:helix-turn-helix domain-containing protein [Chloroflexota bacterium]
MRVEWGRQNRSNTQVTGPQIGPILRERREAMGVTLAEAEVATRIRQKYLAALESDEWNLLPGEVVGRGFLRNYSTYLGLEPTEMIERRRALADETLSVALANTSAASALPPERQVDYRPKDVALHEDDSQLESTTSINLLPIGVALGALLLVALLWWGITQYGALLAGGLAAVQNQIAGWQQTAAGPPPTATLPENLLAPTEAAPTEAAPTEAAPTEAAPAEAAPAEAAPAEAVPAEAVPAEAVPSAPGTPNNSPASAAEPAEASEVSPVSLTALLPTPTPLPAVPAPVARALAAANLRQGPTTDFPVVGAAVEGQELTIVGQLADGSWYVLDNGAWIFGQLVENVPADVPVVAAPAAP